MHVFVCIRRKEGRKRRAAPICLLCIYIIRIVNRCSSPGFCCIEYNLSVAEEGRIFDAFFSRSWCDLKQLQTAPHPEEAPGRYLQGRLHLYLATWSDQGLQQHVTANGSTRLSSTVPNSHPIPAGALNWAGHFILIRHYGTHSPLAVFV